MDYADAYIRAAHALKEVYRLANEKDFEEAEKFAADLLLASKALLAGIQNNK
jgi:hypothetical protein